MKTALKSFARAVASKPKLTVALVLAATLGLGAGMARLRVDADMTDDIPATVPEKAFYDEVGKIFPSDDFLMVAFRHSGGAFAPEALRQTKEGTDALEALPGVKGVLSLSSAGLIRGDEAGIRIEPAMPELPETAEQAAAFRARIEGTPWPRPWWARTGSPSPSS